MNARHAARVNAHKAKVRAIHMPGAIGEHEDVNEDSPYHCGYCGEGMDQFNGGFCTTECERKYGECPKCGAPSRGNRTCPDCRED